MLQCNDAIDVSITQKGAAETLGSLQRTGLSSVQIVRPHSTTSDVRREEGVPASLDSWHDMLP